MFEIIPAIDLLNGKVVRLTQGKYDQVEYYDISPVELIEKYEEAGAQRVHIVDLDGAKEGSLSNFNIIKNIKSASNCKIECGGGIRSSESVNRLLDIGVDFVILGSLLTKNFKTAETIITQFPNKIIAGIDTLNGNVAVEGWIEDSGIKEDDLINQLNELPIESIIHTDISKDGMMAGPNIDSLVHFSNLSKHPIIASGGVSSSADVKKLSDLKKIGIKGCIIGKALLNKAIDLKSIFS